MNAERLRELAEFFLSLESRFQIQAKIEQLRSGLQQLASSPGDQNYQNQVATFRAQLTAAMTALNDQLTPARLAAIGSLGGEPFFSGALVDRVEGAIAANAMTPSVAFSDVGQLFDQRRQFLERLEEARTTLSSLGIEIYKDVPGEAELSFLLPRLIFESEFGLFTRELEHLNFIVNTFTELVTGQAEPATLRQLSTTDPFVAIGVGIAVAPAFGRTVTWILDTWRKSLDIKEWYDRGKELKMPDAHLQQIEKTIKHTVEEAIEKQTKILIETHRPDEKDEPGRHNELANAVTRSQRLLMTRIEQGMQIDVRYLPPPEPKESQTEEDRAQEVAIASEIAVISKQLSFPKPTGVALLRLVLQPDDEDPPADGE
jgi:hypothetical protein